MRINGKSNNISFNKRLAATCSVVQSTGEPLPCNIYKILPNEDRNYLKKLGNDYNWEKNHYLDCLEIDFLEMNELPYTSIYSIEDKDGKCIGLTEVKENLNTFNIEILETAPRFENKRSDSSIKYIGETMVSFITELAKRTKKHMIEVFSASKAVDFYREKCHMNYNDRNKYFYLPAYRYDRLLMQNERHTGSKINIIE